MRLYFKIKRMGRLGEMAETGSACLEAQGPRSVPRVYIQGPGMVIHTDPCKQGIKSCLAVISIQESAGNCKTHGLTCWYESASVHWATTGRVLASRVTRSTCVHEMQTVTTGLLPALHYSNLVLSTSSSVKWILLMSKVHIWVCLHPTSNRKQLPKKDIFLSGMSKHFPSAKPCCLR